MPSAVAKFTVTSSSIASLRVTVNSNAVFPSFPSASERSLIEREGKVGGVSSKVSDKESSSPLNPGAGTLNVTLIAVSLKSSKVVKFTVPSTKGNSTLGQSAGPSKSAYCQFICWSVLESES